MELNARPLCPSSMKEGVDHKVNCLSVVMLPPMANVAGMRQPCLWASVLQSYLNLLGYLPKAPESLASHPSRCTTKPLPAKGEESHGFGSGKSCLRLEGKNSR